MIKSIIRLQKYLIIAFLALILIIVFAWIVFWHSLGVVDRSVKRSAFEISIFGSYWASEYWELAEIVEQQLVSAENGPADYVNKYSIPFQKLMVSPFGMLDSDASVSDAIEIADAYIAPPQVIDIARQAGSSPKDAVSSVSYREGEHLRSGVPMNEGALDQEIEAYYIVRISQLFDGKYSDSGPIVIAAVGRHGGAIKAWTIFEVKELSSIPW